MSKTLSPRQSLNKAFLKVKPNRSGIDLFRKNLLHLFSQIDTSESEEFHKNVVSGFLSQTYYSPAYYINTKGRNDLVIHNGKDAKSPVGVIIETKNPSNKMEMLTEKNINTKAFHELLLYYLRERITHKNLDLKHIVATNVHEWFIFDASVFEKYFGQNKELVQKFIDFDEGRLAGKNTDFFYKEIAGPLVDNVKDEISYAYFDIREYEKISRNADRSDDVKLIALYKLLSPEHLLKLPFANDSNSLDKAFYTELLHLIGLVETKDGGKKLIQRKKESDRNTTSLIENIIGQLESLDKLNKVDKPSQFGENIEDRLFNIALELAITWINRVLFLKLLEAQLIGYQKGNKDFAFLNSKKVKNYDDLNSLFFDVLARKFEERKGKAKSLFEKVPYLNSSLFEPTDLEQQCFFISQLPDQEELPLHFSTVLKDANGKKRTGALLPLDYLFEFLDAYDFSSEGSEEIQEENKTLINASVLGLIFEKINGYKDGSFFTPGFITMYMCRETIRRAVLQKFSEVKKWDCENLVDLHNKIDNKKEANNIINSIKICDPAVGSGHFLVSALNEIIAIKGELKILLDREGKTLKDYGFEVVNDELIITDEDGNLFEYNPRNKESQRLQEALFHEKETIIENCLFGVDINPNSVKICRLRLWIELLKNSYYKNGNELETLPNIDINIKCGNSLISRFALDADMKQALKKSKWNIDSYRLAVQTYRNAQTKEEKRSMEKLINEIKSDFRSEISSNDPKLKKLSALKGELFNLTQQTGMFEPEKKQKALWNEKVEKLAKEISRFESEIEEIKNNKIYERAFEWRFEFPEVLNDDGEFVGFDVVIGNPPYVTGSSFKELHSYFINAYSTSEYQFDLYPFFIELSKKILKLNGDLTLITPNSWLKNLRMEKTRFFVLSNFSVLSINPNISSAFNEAQVDTLIFHFIKSKNKSRILIWSFIEMNLSIKHFIDESRFLENKGYVFDVEVDTITKIIIDKIRQQSSLLSSLCDITRGVNPYDKYRGQSEEIIKSKIYHASFAKDASFVPELRGKHLSILNYQWDKKHYISYGKWLAAPRDPKFFKGKRILFREILGDRFISTIIDEDFINDRSLYIAKPYSDSIDLYHILGVLSSRLLVWFFRYEKNEFDDLFPKIRLEEFKNLPIKFYPDYTQSIISSKIKGILSNCDNTDLALEEIDQLVYQLYGLTAEEITIVEGATK